MVAVAENKGLPETFILSCIKTGGNINKVLNNASENAGDKPQSKKPPRRGKIKISKGPITFVQDQPEPTTFDSEIDLSKRKLFTEYYHNNVKFEILFLNNPECGRAQSCISWKLAFPKDNPVVADGELIITHNERYERTAKDSSGKFLHMTNHIRCKFYCINKSCLLRRHPYFWRSMLFG